MRSDNQPSALLEHRSEHLPEDISKSGVLKFLYGAGVQDSNTEINDADFFNDDISEGNGWGASEENFFEEELQSETVPLNATESPQHGQVHQPESDTRGGAVQQGVAETSHQSHRFPATEWPEEDDANFFDDSNDSAEPQNSAEWGNIDLGNEQNPVEIPSNGQELEHTQQPHQLETAQTAGHDEIDWLDDGAGDWA